MYYITYIYFGNRRLYAIHIESQESGDKRYESRSLARPLNNSAARRQAPTALKRARTQPYA